MKYYGIRKGIKTGIFTSWETAKKYVSGFSGAEYKSFNNKTEAELWVGTKPKLEIVYLDKEGIYTDGGQNSQTGNEAWGCVVDKKGVDLIPHHRDLLTDMEIRQVNLPVGTRQVIISKFEGVKQQNNGAELLALIAGIRIAIKNKTAKNIYCDSDLLVKYWSKKLNSEKRIEMDKRKVDYIDELISLRAQFEKVGGQIVKISGDDNLADLGYH